MYRTLRSKIVLSSRPSTALKDSSTLKSLGRSILQTGQIHTVTAQDSAKRDIARAGTPCWEGLEGYEEYNDKS
jgi:hypothetical protein